jgi:hypothetical protein
MHPEYSNSDLSGSTGLAMSGGQSLVVWRLLRSTRNRRTGGNRTRSVDFFNALHDDSPACGLLQTPFTQSCFLDTLQDFPPITFIISNLFLYLLTTHNSNKLPLLPSTTPTIQSSLSQTLKKFHVSTSVFPD